MTWASWLDQLWRAPNFPMWLSLAAAAFFGIIMVVTLLRADKSVANGALTVITLLALTVAAAATIRGFQSGSQVANITGPSAVQRAVAPAALACIDDLAGDAVLTACEKTLFGSPDSAAAAVSYAASQITRLTSLGDPAAASPELQALRRAVERDRYGLMAYVLASRDRCTPTSCPAFASLGSSQRIASNMDERVYENLITRYTAVWNAPPSAGPTIVGALPSGGMPTGRPTNAEFPSAASTPAVSIMSPEPGTSTPKPPREASRERDPSREPARERETPKERETARETPSAHPAAATPSQPPAPAASPAPTPAASSTPATAAKKQAATPKQRPSAPVQIAPTSPPSAASNGTGTSNN